MQISLKELGSTAENEKSVLVIDEEKLADILSEEISSVFGHKALALAKYLSQNATSFMRIEKE